VAPPILAAVAAVLEMHRLEKMAAMAVLAS
jgi:hypothetical protein